MGLVDFQSQGQRLKSNAINSPAAKRLRWFPGAVRQSWLPVIVPRASITFEAAAIARSGTGTDLASAVDPGVKMGSPAVVERVFLCG